MWSFKTRSRKQALSVFPLWSVSDFALAAYILPKEDIEEDSSQLWWGIGSTDAFGWNFVQSVPLLHWWALYALSDPLPIKALPIWLLASPWEAICSTKTFCLEMSHRGERHAKMNQGRDEGILMIFVALNWPKSGSWTYSTSGRLSVGPSRSFAPSSPKTSPLHSCLVPDFTSLAVKAQVLRAGTFWIQSSLRYHPYALES